MQKTFLLIIAASFIINNANSQITKGNWLVGGSASFSSIKNGSAASAQFKQTNFQISPLAGYFLKDKFAIGLRPSLTYGNNTLGGISHSETLIAIGPFVRYYFLQPEKIFNLFTEAGYSYGSYVRSGSRQNSFSFSAGPVVYFNSSVGLEFTIGYSTTKFINAPGSNTELLFGIGFQIHLEKDK